MSCERFHVIILNDYAHVNGGSGKVALTSAMGLADRGHEVTVFGAVPPVDVGLLNRRNLRVICTGQQEIRHDPNRLRATVQGIWNRKAVGDFEEILRGCDPRRTVVHAHGWTKSLSASVIRKALDYKFKILITLHEYFSVCPNGGFFDFPKQRICQRVPMSLGCVLRNCDSTSYPQKLWRVIRQIGQEWIAEVPRGVHGFISISEFSESVIRPYLPAQAKLYRVVNPIEACRQTAAEVARNREFIFVGRLAPEKGPQLLAHAATAGRFPVTFVGDGVWRRRIEALCPDAEITGWLPASSVIKKLRSARALVFPSLWYETQGLVVLEAAAHGVPAIVPDTCAARDMVIDGVTGLWFRGGDEQDLAAKMQVLQDPAVAVRLGNAAFRTYWSNPCTMERHLEALESCYGDLLADYNRPIR